MKEEVGRRKGKGGGMGGGGWGPGWGVNQGWLAGCVSWLQGQVRPECPGGWRRGQRREKGLVRAGGAVRFACE